MTDIAYPISISSVVVSWRYSVTMTHSLAVLISSILSGDSPYAIGPLSVLQSVTLVYCGQTVGWIKISLGTEVGLGPGHIVLDGTQLPQKGHTAPNF